MIYKILFLALILTFTGCKTLKTEHMITINHNIQLSITQETATCFDKMSNPRLNYQDHDKNQTITEIRPRQ